MSERQCKAEQCHRKGYALAEKVNNEIIYI